MATTYGKHVIRREHIEVDATHTYFRKTWDNGFVDTYVREWRGTHAKRWRITQDQWDLLSVDHPVITGEA